MTATSVAGKARTSRSTKIAPPGRKELQAGDQRQPQSLARRDDGGGIGRVWGHHRIRHRLQPVHLCPGTFRGRFGILFRGAQVGRQHSPAALSQFGQASVGGDLIEPGTHGGAPLEPAVGPPGPQVGLLDQVSPHPGSSRACGSSARATHAGTAQCPRRIRRYRARLISRSPGRRSRRAEGPGPVGIASSAFLSV